jgi:S1-C subfamily serine protease
MSLTPSAAGEQGSSGGPVALASGNLIGLVATKGNPERDGARSLRALSLPYINRTIMEETGVDLATTLAGNLRERAQFFRKSLEPILSTLIANEIMQ